MLAVHRSPLLMLALLATLCGAQVPDDPQPVGPPAPGASAPTAAGGGQGGAPSPAPSPNDEDAKLAQAVPGTRASINGHAITTQDVLVEARLNLVSQPGGYKPAELADPPEGVLQKALANAAREILLSSEAERLGVTLSDFELDELMKVYFGQVPDMELLAQLTGTTAATMRARFRRRMMATLYTQHRLGRDFRYAHLIQSDPNLKRLLEVRPAELKREFLRRREQLAVPERVRYRVHAFDTRDSAEQGMLAAQLGHEVFSPRRPQEWTEPLVTATDRLRYYAGSEDVAEWLVEAPAGAVSDPVEVLDEGPPDDDDPETESDPELNFLVVQVLERLPAREADFALDQDLLLRMLENENYERATRALVLDEARNAVVWPPELFSAP